ncbi:hypothetical protein FBU30_005703 [Linnemannia zychae]|nr:hypothetical protein FBU30_005703 [Linnemannia zychae]
MPSSHAQEGQPPVTYMANLIAQQLLQVGAAMFGRRSDADCILRVGNEQYYVHVQLLASRSSTFRRIFDEMIAKEAWGVSHDVDLSSEDRASFGHLDEEDEEVFNYGSDCGYQDPANISYGEGCGLISDDDENLRDDKSLYTGDNNRWIRFFTPDNYSSILQNILLLNIGTNAVFEICEAFEDTTAPELGLRGMANNVLCVSSQPVSIDTVKNPYRDSAMATLQ